MTHSAYKLNTKPFFTLVATRKFFPADQFARWTGSIVAFMGLKEGDQNVK
jgi:hypothetical protein